MRLVRHVDAASLFRSLADAMLEHARRANASGRRACIVVPVGPIGQYRYLVERCNRERVSLERLVIIAMDEYCTVEGEWIPEEDPMSFRGFLRRNVLERLDRALRPVPGALVVPDPTDLGAVKRCIGAVGGVDAVFGGIGMNGHVAFNEPAPDVDPDAYRATSTRVVDLDPTSRVVNALMCAGGNVSAMPQRCVTIGLAEILAAQSIHLACVHPWQSAAVRMALHGAPSSTWPVTLLQGHPDVTIWVTPASVEQPAMPGLP